MRPRTREAVSGLVVQIFFSTPRTSSVATSSTAFERNGPAYSRAVNCTLFDELDGEREPASGPHADSHSGAPRRGSRLESGSFKAATGLEIWEGARLATRSRAAGDCASHDAVASTAAEISHRADTNCGRLLLLDVQVYAAGEYRGRSTCGPVESHVAEPFGCSVFGISYNVWRESRFRDS